MHFQEWPRRAIYPFGRKKDRTSEEASLIFRRYPQKKSLTRMPLFERERLPPPHPPWGGRGRGRGRAVAAVLR